MAASATTLLENSTLGYFDDIIGFDRSSDISNTSDAINTNGIYVNNNGSLHSSRSSDLNKEATTATVDNSSLVLREGHVLQGESRTEPAGISPLTETESEPTSAPVVPARQPSAMPGVVSMSNGTGTAKARAARSPYTSPPSDAIPVVEITIPNDANVSSFTCDQLANFLRCLNVEDRIISHLHRKQVDGKRFSRLRDSELESLGMNNPVVTYFRDRSSAKAPKKKHAFVL